MKRRRGQPAPTNLRLSGVSAVLGLVAIIIGLIMMVLLPKVRIAAWGVLVLGVILLAIGFVIDFRMVSSAVTGKRGRFSTGTTVMVSVFVGITILVNAISIGNFKRFDTTGLSQFTLTKQTQDVLTGLEMPVKAICFTIPGDLYGSYALDLLDEYQSFTAQLAIEEVDPEENPDTAREYGTTLIPAEYRYPSIVFETEVGQRLVTLPEIYAQAEHSFTSAILEVTGTVQVKIYFLAGHGEADLYSDFTQVRQTLLDYLFKVEELNLTATPAIPDDCAVLVVMAPLVSMSENEMAIVEDYLDRGGKLLVLLNPDSPEDIKQLMAEWGIIVDSGTAIDPTSFLAPNKSAALITQDRNAFGLAEVYFPGSAALVIAEESEKAAFAEPLAITSQESWLERNYDPQQEPEYDEGTDLKGPLTLAAVVYAISPDPGEEVTEEDIVVQMVVVGDSDFASDLNLYNGNNFGFFLNTMSGLTAGAEVISIERKVLPYRRLIVNDNETDFIRISSMALLPFLVLVGGAVIWWRRR